MEVFGFGSQLPDINIMSTWMAVRNVLKQVNYLHSTVSVAEFEVLFAKLLLATHVYCPSSFLLTLVMVNSVPSSEILTLESAPAFIFVSSLYQLIVGFGFPVVLHDRDVFSPSFVVWICGWVENCGPSVGGNKSGKLLNKWIPDWRLSA